MGIAKAGKIIGLLILCIAAIKAGAQDLAGSIYIKIVGGSLVCNSYSKSFLLSFPLSRTCSVKNVGTGMAFAIYKNDGKQIIPTSKIIDYAEQTPMTKEVLDSALQVMHGNFLKSKIELISKEEILFTKEIPLSNYKLQKGKYYFQVVYYSGDNMARNLKSNPKSQTSNGKLFQGCAVSDRIELIIN